MSGWTTTLRPGLPLAYDGEQFTVAEIEGRRVLLRHVLADGRPSWRQVDISVLLSDPGTRFLVASPAAELAAAAVLSDPGTAEDDALTERFRHVQEVLSGYRLGCAELALEGEPRPEYAPGVPLMRRYAAKAAELGVDPATVRRWAAGVKRAGPSPYQGADAGKWPIAVDPGDIRTVYFQDPRNFSWHPLAWEHATALNGPASREAVDYARRLAGQTHRFPDTRRALVELLEWWGTGLTADRTERRMAVRLSQERLRLVGDDDLTPRQGGAPARLLAARRAADSSALPSDSSGPVQAAVASVGAGGDDDRDDECDAAVPEAANASGGEDDFYADAWESR